MNTRTSQKPKYFRSKIHHADPIAAETSARKPATQPVSPNSLQHNGCPMELTTCFTNSTTALRVQRLSALQPATTSRRQGSLLRGKWNASWWPLWLYPCMLNTFLLISSPRIWSSSVQLCGVTDQFVEWVHTGYSATLAQCLDQNEIAAQYKTRSSILNSWDKPKYNSTISKDPNRYCKVT